MRYKGRELRRLWEVTVYEGDPNAKKPKTRTETVIAFNAVEALRKCPGQAAEEPRALMFVTWPEAGNPTIYKIEDTAGPTDEIVNPTVPEPVPPDDF